MKPPTIPRPTEDAAYRSMKAPRPLPPLVDLLAGRLVARLVGDRHGLRLFNHAIARLGGERRES